MADLFKDPPMATFKRPRNLKGMVVRAILENPLPNGVLKHVLMPDAFCASTAPTQTVLKATSRVAPTRYLARRLVAQSASSISSVAKCAWDG